MNKITIDLDKLNEVGLTASEYIFLQLFYEKRYDDALKFSNIHFVEYNTEQVIKALEECDFIKIIDGSYPDNLVLRKKFLSLQDNYVEEDVDFFQKYIDLFPAGVRSGGKLVKSDKKTAEEKLRKFLKKYPYSQETILEATKRYVDKKKREGYAFMRSAVYFIEKQGQGSDLAAECENLKTNPVQETGDKFTDRL